MRDKIILEILDEQIIEKCSTKFYSYIENVDDYIQDMYIEVLSLPDDKLILLYLDGTLFFYILSICRNQATNQKSKYHRTYNLKNTNILSDEKLIQLSDYYESKNNKLL